MGWVEDVRRCCREVGVRALNALRAVGGGGTAAEVCGRKDVVAGIMTPVQ